MKVGASVLPLATTVGWELSGFAVREQPSTGVLDPLRVRALAVEEGAERLLWVHVDLLAIDPATVAGFRLWARETLGLSEVAVLCTATHTHSGPATVPLRAAGRAEPTFLVLLQSTLRQAAQAAWDQREACALVTTQFEHELACHRTGASTRHVDTRVLVASFVRRDGRHLATVVNHAMHPVALGPRNRAFSADFPGAVACALERRLIGSPAVFYVNGAAGNLNPPAENVTPTQLDVWARPLADGVVQALQAVMGREAAERREPRLQVARRVVELPTEQLDATGLAAYTERILATVPDQGFGRRVRECIVEWAAQTSTAGAPAHYPLELHAVGLGHLLWVGVNVEIFSTFTAALREATACAGLGVLGYANGDLGYLCPAAAYQDGGYEVDLAHIFYGGFRFQRGAFEQLLTAAGPWLQQLLSSVPRDVLRSAAKPVTMPRS